MGRKNLILIGKSSWTKILRKNLLTIVIIGIVSIYFLTFVYYPTAQSLYLSLFKTKLLETVEFIGFRNYIEVFKAREFWISLKNTFYFSVIMVIASVVFGLGLALLLNTKISGRAIFRSIIFMPYIIPYAAFAIAWLWLYDPVYGLINYLLNFFNIEAIAWLKSSNWVIPAFIIMNMWKNIGWAMVVYLAGLQTVPDDLYDAATVDGASWWGKFFYVTLPSLKPITMFVLIITLIHHLQLFIEPFVMTKGGPGISSISGVYLIYREAFYSYNMGEASAISIIYFIIIASLTVIILKNFKFEDVYR